MAGATPAGASGRGSEIAKSSSIGRGRAVDDDLDGMPNEAVAGVGGSSLPRLVKSPGGSCGMVFVVVAMSPLLAFSLAVYFLL